MSKELDDAAIAVAKVADAELGETGAGSGQNAVADKTEISPATMVRETVDSEPRPSSEVSNVPSLASSGDATSAAASTINASSSQGKAIRDAQNRATAGGIDA